MGVPLLDLKRQYASIKAELDAAMGEVAESQQFILGPTVRRFEEEAAAYCGVKYAVGVSSGSDALLISLMALGVGSGDEVITSTFTFFATAGSIARLGAKPVFVDIVDNDFNIDTGLLERKITPRTKAIIPVHLYGQLCNMDEIKRIAASNGVPIIEDAAQSIGASVNGRRACSFGLAGCLSFFPTKNLGCFGDGGMVLTNDEEFYKKLLMLRVHGMEPKYFHNVIGGNFRLDALQAAILSVKLRYLEGWNDSRRRNAFLYGKLLADKNEIVLPSEKAGFRHVYNQFVVRVPSRQKLEKRLREAGIGFEIYYPLPLHMQECFSYLGYKQGDFPVSEKTATEVLALPIFPELAEEEINQVSSEICKAYR